jgi:hypothetical protein
MKKVHRHPREVALFGWDTTRTRHASPYFGLRLGCRVLTALILLTFGSHLSAMPGDDSVAIGRIIISGQLSSSSACQGEELRFWITISNRGGSPVKDIRLEHLDTPGFKLDRRCWVQTPPPECGVPSNSPEPAPTGDPSLIAGRLEAGQSRTIWGDLQATKPNHKQSLVAVVGWSSDGQPVSWSSAVLGQAASITSSERLWTQFRDVVKDVGMPILLLVASLWFGVRQHVKENEEEAEQTKRAQLAEVWKQMLPESHQITKNHYLPLLGAAQQSIQKLDSFCGLPDKTTGEAKATLRMAFYHLMLFAWNAREANWNIGGYYFKDRIGERLVYSSYFQYFSLYGDDEDTITSRTRLLDLMSARTTLADFLALEKNIGYSQVVWQRAWDQFVAWITGPKGERTLPFLRAFIAVLDYEANRPYELWYGGNYPVEVSDSANRALESLVDTTLTLEAIRNYVKSVKGSN